MRKYFLALVIASVVFSGARAFAGDITVPMNLVSEQGAGQRIGAITITEGPKGLVFTPDLKGLSPGVHGFHVHQNPDCSAALKDGKLTAALAAGGHYDPAGTGMHQGPQGNGHLGDLPALTVAADGSARTPVIAPRLTMADVKGRSLMIHAGGDNYADQPAPLGGGGARVACGVVK